MPFVQPQVDPELHLAALAGGIDYSPSAIGASGLAVYNIKTDKWCTWNPRENDGDAMRLAAKLGATVKTYCTPVYIEDKPYVEVELTRLNSFYSGKRTITCREEYTNDHMQAIRTAIFGVAVEVGKEMLTQTDSHEITDTKET